jgi:hypothetical protein
MPDIGDSTRGRAGNHMMCDWCGRATPANYVHGHIQCVHCHRNIAPCCEGEVCVSVPADKATPD